MTVPFACAVAIPARDEAKLLPRCLDALAQQTVGIDRFMTVVIANNCNDDTADCARKFNHLVNLQVEEITFDDGLDHAGSARRKALGAAARYAPIILTTDADCVPDKDWVEKMLAAFNAGVDAVAGAVSGDWIELQHLPFAAFEIGRLEWEYLALLAHAEAVFDPLPHDPMPRHAQCCGANLGITAKMLMMVGGVPAIPTGEDRALVAAVEQHGGKVRHDPSSHVTASARITGRAFGGMADALAQRLTDSYVCDEQFERADRLVSRLKARRRMRSAGKCKTVRARGNERLTPAMLEIELKRLSAILDAYRG